MMVVGAREEGAKQEGSRGTATLAEEARREAALEETREARAARGERAARGGRILACYRPLDSIVETILQETTMPVQI